PGTYPIRLTVTEDGCSSVIPTQADSVFVSAPLGAVELQCLPATFDSVVFLWDPLPGVALYAVEVLGGASIIQTETSFTVAGLQPGEAVTLIVTPQSISACGPGTADTLTCFVATCPDLSADFSALPTSVCLEPSVMPIPLEATIIGSGNIDSVFNWSGTGVVGRNFNPIVAGVGEHWIFLDYAEEGPCTLRDSFLISVFSLPTGDFTLSTSDICLGDTIEVNYSGTASPDADFDWEFGAANILSGAGGGPYTLTWDAPGTYPIRLIVTENGCSSISPTEADSVTVNAPLPPVDLQCGPISFDSVTIVWNPVAGAINYSVVIIGGAFSIQADTSITLTGLMPGEIVQMVVRPIGTGACGTGPADTISCMVRACPDLSIDFSAIDSTVCFESTTGPVNLVAIVNGASGAMASENWSGPGVVGNIFDPQLVGPGIYTLIFDYQEEGPCKITDSIRMIVSVPPPSNFSITPEDICITESTTIEYIGTASDAAIFNWDFGVGSIESGSGRGPYSVSWDEPGIYPVSLTVSEAGCVDASATVTRTLTVSAPLDSLTLRCEPATLNTVTISWDSIPGIDAYEVILEDTLPYLTLDTVLEISGLLPGDSAVISVIPLGSTACGDGPGDTITCFAAPCPELSIDFSAIDPLVCLDENTQPLFLNAVVSGGNGINASQTWSGPGVSGSIFDPRGLGPGVYWLTLSYTEKGPCGIIDSFSVKVVATPTGEFAIDPGDICFGDSVLVEYTGTAGPTAEFDWEFGEANIISGEGEGPYWLDFPDGGTYPIRLTVTEEDCSTEVSTQEDSIVVSMPVGMPLIRCGPSSINGVSFLWDPVVNATEYGVQLFGEGAFFQDTTGFIVDGLLPGDSVTIAVLPLGPPPCGNGPLDTLTCFALPCPTITVDLSTIPVSVCLDENTPQIALEAIINGGSGINPDTTWSGPGVVDNVFDPRLAGVGRHTIQLLYNELGPCEVSESHIIEVFAIPTADFNVSTNDICLGDTVEVVYIGNAVEGAFFDWDFSGASILSGSGPGPYSIVWATPGTYLVRLSVEQNACTSVGGGRIDSVQVFAPLSATEISCEGETLNSVSFSWTEVIGADGYDIEIIGGDRFTSDETFLTVDNLPLETNVTIVVTPLASNICGD
ncbi:MAG: hypothetical protein AAFU03_04800, partial [Bacteroidota bacterium]